MLNRLNIHNSSFKFIFVLFNLENFLEIFFFFNLRKNLLELSENFLKSTWIVNWSLNIENEKKKFVEDAY